MTHCGHGTTIRTLAVGLPMVCIPMGRDQNDNAARVVACGAGIRLAPSATAEKIRAAVEHVLSNSKLAAGARRMKAAIAEEARTIDVVGDIEKVAGMEAQPAERVLAGAAA